MIGVCTHGNVQVFTFKICKRYNFFAKQSDALNCKHGPGLNSHLTQEGRKQLNWVKYASPGAHSSEEKQKNRKVRLCLVWGIFDLAEPHSTLWSQMGVELGTGLRFARAMDVPGWISIKWKSKREEPSWI
jgi:hypothetical protein